MVQIYSTKQPYRVMLGKSADIRIVVTEQIVVQSGFAIQVLALQTQVLGIIQRLLVFPVA
ncbi:hypothetical protein GCM10023078_16110 [Gibbsiella greigii]